MVWVDYGGARLGIRITTLYYIITTRSLQVNQKKCPPVLWYHYENRQIPGNIYPLKKRSADSRATCMVELMMVAGLDGLLGEVLDG